MVLDPEWSNYTYFSTVFTIQIYSLTDSGGWSKLKASFSVSSLSILKPVLDLLW